MALASCGQVVRYTDEIVDQRTGRSWFVTGPATFGGFCGFAIGLPVDVLALPVTFIVYRVQRARDELEADPVSTMLFPSFVLWRGGRLLGVPFDMLEYAAFRGWRSPDTRTEEEQRAIEYEFDEETLPQYPVETIYPASELKGSGADRAASDSSSPAAWVDTVGTSR